MTQTATRKNQSSSKTEVQGAIPVLPRAIAIDLLDEALGVGCYDEQDDVSVRAEVTAAYKAGQIDAEAILEA